MPTCTNCGSDVSRQYMRVFAPDETGNPKSCPRCSLGRDGGEVAEESGDDGDGVDWVRMEDR